MSAARGLVHGMTAFGAGSAEEDGVRFEVEIRGVNNRFLDQRVKLPAEFAHLEADVKKRIQERVARGRVETGVVLSAGRPEGLRLEVRQDLARAYLAAARDLRRRHRLRGAVAVDRLLGLPGVVQIQPEAALDREAAVPILWRAFDAALAAFVAMRAAEGRRLTADLRARFAAIGSETDAIAGAAEHQPARQAERLKARLESLLGDGRLEPARLAQEVALLAERLDVSEEIVRLRGFVEQGGRLLEGEGAPVGKTLDFVMQEMNREANTIASKSEDLAICQAALRVRAAVEAIREQVQNLE